jgi:hypothetical protein
MLAVTVAQYKQRHGEIPREEVFGRMFVKNVDGDAVALARWAGAELLGLLDLAQGSAPYQGVRAPAAR